MNSISRVGRATLVFLCVGLISFGVKKCTSKVVSESRMSDFEKAQLAEMKRQGIDDDLKYLLRDVKSPDEAAHLSAILIYMGLLRSSDNVVRERAAGFRNVADLGDPDACSLIWFGARPGFSTKSALPAYDRLDHSDLKAFTNAIVAAMKAEINEDPFMPRYIGEEQEETAWQLLGNEILEDDIDQFIHYAEFPEQLPRSKVCWAVTTLYGSALRLPSAEGAAFLRMMAVYELELLQEQLQRKYP